jgi:anti-sigma B factor antagonist
VVNACEISSSAEAGRRVLTVVGEVDLGASAGFEAEITGAVAALAGGEELVLDLTGVGFLDSSGLRALLHGANAAAEAEVRLTVLPSEAVARVLEITRIGPEVLGIESAREEPSAP